MITLFSHKIGGPRGIGALYCRSRDILKNIELLILGGGQEFGFRSDAENVSAIASFITVFKEAVKLRIKEAKRLMEIKKYLFDNISIIFPGAKVNDPKIEKGSPSYS
jgi:cysteine desulfurase